VGWLPLIIQVYALIVLVDVGLAWLQPPQRWPRRALHPITEPPQALLRRVLPPRWTGGLDLSPLVLLAGLGGLRIWWIQP
jgi:uncharacterized protein YggT (Ycf19 family)